MKKPGFAGLAARGAAVPTHPPSGSNGEWGPLRRPTGCLRRNLKNGCVSPARPRKNRPRWPERYATGIISPPGACPWCAWVMPGS